MSLYDNAPALFEPILAFQRELRLAEAQPPVLCGEQSFPLLLAGIPAMRLTPGLSTLDDLGKDYFTSIPFCRDEEATAQAREHLEQTYHYSDKDSLIAFCRESLHIHPQYLDFESFWDGRPNFALEELPEQSRQVFTACSDFARQFQPILGRRGFLAWDISETLGLLRSACACRLITVEEFRELTAYWLEQSRAFHSWGEYALDLVCGSAYWAYRMGCSLEEIADYVQLNLRLVRDLLKDKRAWCGRMWWRKPGQKAFRLSPAELRPLLGDWQGGVGCLATDRIVVDGRPVGYCYREEPTPGQPDSGWRFLAGDEDEAYLSNLNHSGVYHLNDICNYDPDIIPPPLCPLRHRLYPGRGRFISPM